MAETKLNEPNMNTIAAVDRLMKSDFMNAMMKSMLYLTRKQFAIYLAIESVMWDYMSLQNAVVCVDWDYVADSLFLQLMMAADE